MNKRSLSEYITSIHVDPKINDQPLDYVSSKMPNILNDMFEKDMTADDWPYNFKEYGIDTNIKELAVDGRNRIYMDLEFTDKEEVLLLSKYRVKWSADGKGTASIFIANINKNKNYNGSVKVNLPDLLLKANKDFLKKHPSKDRENSITLDASSNEEDGLIGAYVWANKGFDFSDKWELIRLRSEFKDFLKEKGISIKDEELELLKKPCHFSAFDNGTKSIINIKEPIKLTKKQLDTKSLSGKYGKQKLSKEELKTGKTKRISVHIGKEFMAKDQKWYAIWTPSIEKSECAKFAKLYKKQKNKTYIDMKEKRALDIFAPEQKKLMQKKPETISLIKLRLKKLAKSL